MKVEYKETSPKVLNVNDLKVGDVFKVGASTGLYYKVSPTLIVRLDYPDSYTTTSTVGFPIAGWSPCQVVNAKVVVE